MNWTEGTLARHAHGRSRNQDRTQQKRFFAKSRTNKALQTAATISLEKTPLFQVNIVSQRPSRTTTQVASPKSRVGAGRAQILTSGTKRKSPENSGREDNGGNDLAAKRQRLLGRADWAGVDIQKPISLSRPIPRVVCRLTQSNREEINTCRKETRSRLEVPRCRQEPSVTQTGTRSHFFSTPSPGGYLPGDTEASPLIHHPRPVRPDATRILESLESSFKDVPASNVATASSVMTDSDRYSDNLIPLRDTLPDTHVNVNFLDTSSVAGHSVEAADDERRRIHNEHGLNRSESTCPGPATGSSGAGEQGLVDYSRNVLPRRMSPQRGSQFHGEPNSLCSPRKMVIPSSPKILRHEVPDGDGVIVSQRKQGPSSPFWADTLGDIRGGDSQPWQEVKDRGTLQRIEKRRCSSPALSPILKNATKPMPDRDEEAAWMDFIFDEEDSDELHRAAFDDAKHEAAMQLVRSIPSFDASESDLTTRAQPSETGATIGTDMLGSESSQPPSSTVVHPASDTLTQSEGLSFSEFEDITDEDLLSLACTTGAGTETSHARRTAQSEIGSTIALHGSPRRRQGKQTQPPRSDFKFRPPEVFVGRNADISRSFGVQVAMPVKKGRGRPRSGKGARFDGRPSIRNIPHYEDDPVEDSDD